MLHTAQKEPHGHLSPRGFIQMRRKVPRVQGEIPGVDPTGFNLEFVGMNRSRLDIPVSGIL